MRENQSVESVAEVLHGIDAFPVRLSVYPTAGGGLSFVGWKEVSAREISIRVRSALQTVSVSLDAGAALRVHIDRDDWSGVELDLCAAVALAAYSGRFDTAKLAGVALSAELALDGRLRPVRGVVSLAEAAKARGARLLVVAKENRAEAEQVGGIRVETPVLFSDLVDLLARDLSGVGEFALPRMDRDGAAAAWKSCREALDGGARCLLLVGPPGSKTTLARVLASRLPVMVEGERREVARVTSAAGLAHEGQGWARRPFRAPHHSCSEAGLVGGGVHCRPGEVSLAHRGTLLLDEANEFSMRAIDAVGCALRDRQVVLSARGKACSMPAEPRLVIATTNPCPCGWHGTTDAVAGSSRECRCTPEQIGRYRSRGLGRLGELVELTVRLP